MRATTFLNDPEVGQLPYDESHRKYQDMTVQEMLDVLLPEIGERIQVGEPILDRTEDGREIYTQRIDQNMYRIFHTLAEVQWKLNHQDQGMS